MAIISFHSLEDRMVKRFFASKANVEQPDRRLPIRAVDLPQPELKLLSKMKPSDREVDENPRARSAVMRVARRCLFRCRRRMSGKINLVLTILLVACGLSLVNAQYQARHLFIELERSQSQARQLDIEWAQLQLDQSTLGKHARIEEIAAVN
jgi:cell division protein FtsL